jgi:hypothetical protein
MNRPSFFEGVGVALAASIGGAVLFAVLGSPVAGGWLLHVIIAGIGLGYVVYLLRRSRARVGRVVAVSAWSVAAVAGWWLGLPLLLYVALHIGLVWLIRSLYFHSSLFASLADLGLNGLALAAAVWAGAQTGSLLIALWCFFLLQALFVLIPPDLRTPGHRPAADGDDTPFRHAHRVAEAAVRRLSSIQ